MSRLALPSGAWAEFADPANFTYPAGSEETDLGHGPGCACEWVPIFN